MSDKAKSLEDGGDNLLVDGSFETANIGAGKWTSLKSVGGWQSDTGIEVWGKNFNVKASDGDKVMELDFDTKFSRVWQDVSTEKGAEYEFAFDYAQRPDTQAATNTIEVWWNGERVGVIEPGSTDWSQATFKVVGTGGNDRIEFREQDGDNDSYGGLIDNVSLVRVAAPEPVVEHAHEDDKTESKGKDANNDDDKHDGRGHGDGDHNDDGHADNGKGSDKDDPPVDDRVITLVTADVTDALTSQTMVGSNDADGMVGGEGNDHLRGKDGNDEMHGDETGSFSVALDIKASLSGTYDPDALKLIISGLPSGASLSAGQDNGDGSWTLLGSQLAGLELRSADAGAFDLKVVAMAADGSGLSATESIHVTFEGGHDDFIEGGKGNDLLFGDAGNDLMYGASMPTDSGKPPAAVTAEDNDVIHGGAGNDVIYGNHGDDRLFGDEGNDWVSGGKGDDFVSGGEGDDIVYGNTGNDFVSGGDGDDEVNGGKGDDVLSDGAGNDNINAGSGDDWLIVGEGDDNLRGGSGFDTLDFSGAKQGIHVELSKNVAEGMGHDIFNSIEGVSGSDFNDFIIGSTKDNVLVGGAGDDVLRGGRGNDLLTGGEGDDTFVFNKSDVVLKGEAVGVDTITDFGVGHDVLDIRDLLKGQSFGSIDEVLSVKDDGQSSAVFARIGGEFMEVAVLENFTGHTAEDMLKDGMLLVG
jgi:Ca2+-binding RTX toxin-like protein